MNIFRQLTLDEDEEDNSFMTHVESCLQHLFTDEVYERIYAGRRSSGNPLINSVMRHVEAQNQTLDNYHSQEDLFRHYGLRIQQESCFRSIVDWILRVLPFTRTTTAVDPLKTMAVLATIFIQENPDGGLGYSFGTLLERYITHHCFFHFHSLLEDIQYHLIGGTGPFCIPNNHSEQVFETKRDDGSGVRVNLHLVRGTYIASSGQGSLLDRVKKEMGEFLNKEDEYLYLCHGTSVGSASVIAREAPTIEAGASSADFGRAFYLTESWQYAILAAHQAKANSTTPMECAVLVFPVLKSLLGEWRLLDLRNDHDRWVKAVRNRIRKKSLVPDDLALHNELLTAQCIVGPTVKNFDKVHAGRQKPRESQYVQWAFPDDGFIVDVFREIIDRGNWHLFRFIHEYEGEWESSTREHGEADIGPQR